MITRSASVDAKYSVGATPYWKKQKFTSSPEKGSSVQGLHRQLRQAGQRHADRQSDADHLEPAPGRGSRGRAELPGHKLSHRPGVTAIFTLTSSSGSTASRSWTRLPQAWRRTRNRGKPASRRPSAWYPYWTGERRNRRRKKQDRIEIDVSHDALAIGSVGPDRIRRHIVNILDAENGGCDLLDI